MKDRADTETLSFLRAGENVLYINGHVAVSHLPIINLIATRAETCLGIAE